MMDFSELKKLSIGGVELKQLFINGVQVWRSGYTNLIETATTDPGGTEIYGGMGYRDGYRWSLSGGCEAGNSTDGRLSGWMPFVSGATYRAKNFNAKHGYNSGLYIVMYLSDGTVSASHYDYEVPKNGASYNTDTDTWTITIANTTATHFRLSAYKGDNEPIVTMNEEILEGYTG